MKPKKWRFSPGTCHSNANGEYMVLSVAGNDLHCQHITQGPSADGLYSVYYLGHCTVYSLALQQQIASGYHSLPFDFPQSIAYLKKEGIDFDPSKKMEAYLVAVNHFSPILEKTRRDEATKIHQKKIEVAIDYLRANSIAYNQEDENDILEKWHRHQNFMKLVEVHSHQLERHGKNTDGVKLTFTNNERTSVCFLCHSPLGGPSTPQCSQCHWMVCYCGACGCIQNGMPIRRYQYPERIFGSPRRKQGKYWG